MATAEVVDYDSASNLLGSRDVHAVVGHPVVSIIVIVAASLHKKKLLTKMVRTFLWRTCLVGVF